VQRLVLTFNFEYRSPGPIHWRVGYEPGPPRNTAGNPVPVAGTAVLMVRVDRAALNSRLGPVEGYSGPRDIKPTTGPVREVRFVDDAFHMSASTSVMEWALGVDVARPVRVIELLNWPNPSLVVDIATG
jgi:hypothetical protein